MGILNNSRQEIFCQNVANGRTLTDSAIKAGYKQTKNLAKNTHKLMGNPDVANRIREIKKELEQRYILTREELLVELGRIIRSGTSRDNDIISAVNSASKLQGLDENTINLNIKKSVENLSDEELAKIIEEESKDE